MCPLISIDFGRESNSRVNRRGFTEGFCQGSLSSSPTMEEILVSHKKRRTHGYPSDHIPSLLMFYEGALREQGKSIILPSYRSVK